MTAEQIDGGWGARKLQDHIYEKGHGGIEVRDRERSRHKTAVVPSVYNRRRKQTQHSRSN